MGEIGVMIFIVLFAFASVFVGDSEIDFSPRENNERSKIFEERTILAEEMREDISFRGEWQVFFSEEFGEWIETEYYVYDFATGKRYKADVEDESKVPQVSGKIVEAERKATKEIVEEKETLDGKDVKFSPPDFNDELRVSKFKFLNPEIEDFIETEEVVEEKKVAVILMKNGASYQYPESSFFENLIFNENDAYKVNNWISENSYGGARIDGDVYGWYNSHQGENCLFAFSQNFLNELISLGVPIQNYDYIHVIRPGNCYGSGYGTVGKVSYLTNSGEISLGISLTSAWQNFSTTSSGYYVGIIAHELGHNFGLGHANRLHCSGDILRDGCKDYEYGDFFSHMGQNFFQSFNPSHKKIAGWLDEDEILEITHSGEYILQPYGGESSGVKALKISGSENLNYIDGHGVSIDGEISDFYIEFRRPISYDDFFYSNGWWLQQNNFVSADYQDGAYVSFTLVGDPRTHRLDLNPGYPTGTPWDPIFDGADVVLREGETADLSEYGFSLTTLDVNENFLRVYVDTGSSDECVENSSLQLHYDFNNNLNDLSENGRNGSPTGEVNYSSDVANILTMGKSLESRQWFYLQAANSQNLLPAENSSTICFWTKYSSNNVINDARIISKGITPAIHVVNVGLESFVKKSSTNLRFGSATSFAEYPYPANQWHFVCNVYEPTATQKLKIYVDGNLAASQTNVSFQTTSEPLTIGALTMDGNLVLTNGQPHFFKGKIDELTVWNGALTMQEIDKLYEKYLGEAECLI